MKTYNIEFNIGRAKYLVSFCTGESFYPDGSLFIDIRIFSNKVKMNSFIRELTKLGYKYK